MRSVTEKVDVFSFGVIIMEVITKRRPTGLTEEGLPITLRQLVQKAYSGGGINSLMKIMDPHLTPYVKAKQELVEGLVTLALSCTNTEPEDRPNMEQVLSSLSKLSKLSSNDDFLNK